MQNPNGALVKWVQNLTSSQPFTKAADCIVSMIVYSNWPIVNGEKPVVEHAVPIGRLMELAKVDGNLIQRARIKFSVETATTHEEYDCEINHSGTGEINRKCYNLATLSGKCVPFDKCYELPYEQLSNRGGMMPTAILTYFDKARPLFVPAFLTDLISFLKQNDYFGITVAFGNHSGTYRCFQINQIEDNLKQIGKEANLLDINDFQVTAKRRPNDRDSEEFRLNVKNRRVGYIRTITRVGAKRQFGQSADNLPLTPFSNFALTHFCTPTEHAFTCRVYFVGEPMSIRPPEHVRMFANTK